MQLQTLISNEFRSLKSRKGYENLVQRLSDILSSECEEMTDDYLKEQFISAESTAIKKAREIQQQLNTGEETHERLDPALAGLRTDQWKCYIRSNPNAKFKGGFFRDSRGRFAKKYQISIWNMQKPYFYRFDFRDEALPLYVKKNNAPQWAQDLGKDNRMYVTPEIPTSTSIQIYMQDGKKVIPGALTNQSHHREYKTGSSNYRLVPNRTSKAISGRRKVGAYNGTGGVFHSVGNLAAVRLSQRKGIVKPRAKNGWLVFWNNGKVWGKVNTRRRLQSGNSGYVFVRSRQKSGQGHVNYRNWVMSILEDGKLTFIDDLWHK